MDTSVPTCATEGGNTKSPSLNKKNVTNAGKNWCFTWNNYPTDYMCAIKSILDNCEYVICGEEIGESGTPHIQGYLRLKVKKRFENIGLPKQVHWKIAKGSKEDNYTYCTKENTNIFEFPEPPKPVKIIENLKPWQSEIEDLYLSEPDDRKIYWYWESVGGIGKSAFVKYMVVKYNCLFCDGGRKSDIINLVFNNNMDKCRCIIWDLSRAKLGNISYDTLESLKNGLICNTKYETGVKAFNPPHVFVFANAPPAKPEMLSADRWVIKKL